MGNENSDNSNNLIPNKLVIPARLSSNVIIHLIIMVIVNIGVATTLLSIYSFAYFSDRNNVLIFIVVFTFIEFIVKSISFNFFVKYILLTYGMLLFAETLLLYAVVDIANSHEFYFISMERLIAFTIVFSLIRLIVLTYINKKLMIRRMKKAMRYLNGK